MANTKGSPPAVRFTLANGSTVVGGVGSLARILELAFSHPPQTRPVAAPKTAALSRKRPRPPSRGAKRPA